MKLLLIFLLFAIPAHAAELEAGAAHLMMMAGDNGALTIDSSRGFSAHGEVFWSDAISTRVTATFLNPAAYTEDTDLGTLGLELYSATARWQKADGTHTSSTRSKAPCHSDGNRSSSQAQKPIR